MALTPDLVVAVNSTVKRWTLETKKKMVSKIITNGVRDNMTPGELTEDLRTRVTERGGLVEKTSFTFPRYGVYYEKGARKGYGGAKGSRWMSKTGEKSTNPNSFGKMNTGKSKEKPWFNPVMRVEHPKLAEQLADISAEASIKDVTKWLIK